MSVTLSSADVIQLQNISGMLLSPLEYGGPIEWLKSIREATAALLRADRSATMLPLEGDRLIQSSDELVPAYDAYLAYYHTLDTGLHVRRRELGLEVCHWSQLYDMAALPKTEIYNDWSLPNGLLDATCMVAELEAQLPIAGLWLYHERETSPPFGERGLTLLQLLLPAFKAGVSAVRQYWANRSFLAEFVDRLPQGVLVVNTTGKVLHETPLLRRILASEPEGARLKRELIRTGTAAAELFRAGLTRKSHDRVSGPAWREFRSAGGHYRYYASFLGAPLFAPEGVVLVTLECFSLRPLLDDELVRRFFLTKREIQVARLVERGMSLPSIARQLGVSLHTARHHAEHLRTKFGVERLAEVGAKMRH